LLCLLPGLLPWLLTLLLPGFLPRLLALLLPGLLPGLLALLTRLAALPAVLRLAFVVLIHISTPNLKKNNLNAHHPNYRVHVCSNGKNRSVSCQYIFQNAPFTPLIPGSVACDSPQFWSNRKDDS
jgi:hypothetical protein